ncbi:MAG: hypothetical protein MJZ76_05280 [Bacteroidales bacterium]|nr:hypothetical protein [Bacteroidales bacterium]
MNNKIKFSKKSKPQPQKLQYDLYSHDNAEAENGFAKMLLTARSNTLDTLASEMDKSDHKFETVTTKNGIEIIDDSHAINANRLWYALDRVSKPTTWITSINSMDVLSESLTELINEKVKVIVAQSVFDLDVLAYFENLGKKIIVTDNMEEAVRKAFYASESGDAILFSPGTRSEGQYATYRERGSKFQEAVAQL